MQKPYEDIIHMTYPFPTDHPRMSLIDRAAQFSPFSALVGFEEIIEETRRLSNDQNQHSQEPIEELLGC